MHEKVEIKPSSLHCRFCLNVQQDYNHVEYCFECPYTLKGILVDTVSTILGVSGVVQFEDRTLNHIPLERIIVLNEEDK